MGKITRPILKGILPRKRLFRMLDGMREHPIIWVSGPAGCGKTTLVSSYLDARKLPCLWFQLDEDDADLATFFYYLGLAGKKAAPQKRKAFPLLTSEFRQGIPAFTRRYFETLYGRLKIPSILVLDNYQDVPEESLFHEMILHGLSVIPNGINVVMVSRKEPPPVFIRLQANQLMEIIGWNELRLTLEESARMVRLRSRLKWSKEWLKHLYRTTDGWAAGLVLMVENAKKEGIAPQLMGKITPEEVFRYFSRELFEKTDKEMQDFLLKTAFLPKMTARMAEELTGLASSAHFLSNLSRDNYFTMKSFQNEPIYQYHPLLRDFLLAQARGIFPLETLSTLFKRGSAILEQTGEAEAAVSLLREVGDWDTLIGLILKQAPLMVDQGRYAPLEAWLRTLPNSILENNPWLLHWMGMCRLPYDPPQSQSYFEKAFLGFKTQVEPSGIILALWGIVESIRVSGGDLRQLDRWIPILEELNDRFKVFPTPEAELRFVSTMVGAMIYRQPHHPEIQKWTERAFSLTQRPSSANLTNLRIDILSHLNMYYNLTGDFEKAMPVIDAIKIVSHNRNVSPIVHIGTRRAESIYYRCTVQTEKCLRAVSDGLELSRTTGIHVFDHFLLVQGISCALNLNDILKAESWLAQEPLAYPFLGSWHRSLYHLQRARIDLLRGDFSQAAFNADLAITLSVEAGSPYTMAYSHILNSLIKHGQRKEKEAKDHLAQVFGISQKIRAKIYEFSALLIEALFAFDRGEEESGWVSLRKALVCGKERRYFYPYIDMPGGMSRLCMKALDAGIEVEYIQELIRRCQIEPNPPPWHLENWPWFLKIFTLGRFALIREGNPIRFSRKVQQKPLSMLKALVALGGKDVGEGQIIDALWPEAEGDAAHQLFETTLHRLRQLISSPEAVQRREGRLTLNQNHCWVDAWAFERLISQALNAQWEKPSGGCIDDLVLQAQQAIDFYGGIFLPGDAQEFWTNSLRERLRGKFLRGVEKLGRHWQKSGQYEKAVECFQRGLEADDILEEFYQALMLLYQRMNQPTEAISVYTRCKKALFTSLGIEPSQKTEAIRKSILLRKNP